MSDRAPTRQRHLGAELRASESRGHTVMRRSLTGTVVVLIGLGAGMWMGGCHSDDGTGPVLPPPPPGPPVASDPVLVAPAGNVRASLSPTATLDVSVAYIALPPGSAPDGRTATISNLRTSQGVALIVTEGGFDPTAIPAIAGDTIAIAVRDGSGNIVLEPPLLVITAKRPPIVVRTNPPPRKRDVPLNSRITIVFSEPIDAATVTSSTLQLKAGSQLVAGTLVFRDSDHVAVLFIPSEPLSPATTYALEISGEIQDLDGDRLEMPVTVEFTTATSGGYEEFFVDVVSGDINQWADDTVRSLGNLIVFDGAGTGIEGVVLRVRASTGVVEPQRTTSGLGGLATIRWTFGGVMAPPPTDSIAEFSACASNSATRCDMYWPILIVGYNPR